jgi:hypothetical protein
MPRKYIVTPELALECAVRAEVIGRSGVEFRGRIYSSEEIRRMFTPSYPLPPFNQTQPSESNGSDSSNGY